MPVLCPPPPLYPLYPLLEDEDDPPLNVDSPEVPEAELEDDPPEANP